MTTLTHDELRRLTARMLDDEAIGEHDRSRLLAYITNAEQVERELKKTQTLRSDERAILDRAFKDTRAECDGAKAGLLQAHTELATLRPLAAVVREHSTGIQYALRVALGISDYVDARAQVSPELAANIESARAAAKALAGVLGK